MKRVRVAMVLAATAFAAVLSFVPAAAGGDEAAVGVRVGVYDSRLVALAYGRSDEFTKRLGEMRSDLDAAKARGDEKTVARLEAGGPALQEQLHRQVFGNAPIPAIMERIRKDLPAIARDAGVDLVVCKWDIAWQDEDAELVDVSGSIMKLFKPTPETLEMAEKIRSQPPVPAEKLDRLDH